MNTPPIAVHTLPWKEFFDDNNIKIEKGDYATAFDVHGKPFVVVTSSGIKEQGVTVSALFSTPTQAWKEFEDKFLVWLDGRRRLHIRMEPTLHPEVLSWSSGWSEGAQFI